MLVREGATLLRVLHVYADPYGTVRYATLQRVLIGEKPKKPAISRLVHLVAEDVEQRRLDEPTKKQLNAMKVYYG
jgi:hypothetical protein